jgi:hypothetical protein
MMKFSFESGSSDGAGESDHKQLSTRGRLWCPYGVHNNAKMRENDGNYSTTEREDKYKGKRGLACVFKHLPNPLRTKCKTDALPLS